MSDSVGPHRRGPPGSPFPGILQARALEWGAVAFSAETLSAGSSPHAVVLTAASVLSVALCLLAENLPLTPFTQSVLSVSLVVGCWVPRVSEITRRLSVSG